MQSTSLGTFVPGIGCACVSMCVHMTPHITRPGNRNETKGSRENGFVTGDGPHANSHTSLLPEFPHTGNPCDEKPFLP